MASSLAQGSSTLITSQKESTAPYGSWKSPVSFQAPPNVLEAPLLTPKAISFGWSVALLSQVLVKETENPGDEPIDIKPKRYGEGAFRNYGDTVIFSDNKD